MQGPRSAGKWIFPLPRRDFSFVYVTRKIPFRIPKVRGRERTSWPLPVSSIVPFPATQSAHFSCKYSSFARGALQFRDLTNLISFRIFPFYTCGGESSFSNGQIFVPNFTLPIPSLFHISYCSIPYKIAEFVALATTRLSTMRPPGSRFPLERRSRKSPLDLPGRDQCVAEIAIWCSSPFRLADQWGRCTEKILSLSFTAAHRGRRALH